MSLYFVRTCLGVNLILIFRLAYLGAKANVIICNQSQMFHHSAVRIYS
jgi:hypothetical protein